MQRGGSTRLSRRDASVWGWTDGSDLDTPAFARRGNLLLTRLENMCWSILAVGLWLCLALAKVSKLWSFCLFCFFDRETVRAVKLCLMKTSTDHTPNSVTLAFRVTAICFISKVLSVCSEMMEFEVCVLITLLIYSNFYIYFFYLDCQGQNSKFKIWVLSWYSSDCV